MIYKLKFILIMCIVILNGCETSLGTATRVDREFANVSDIDISTIMSIGGLRVQKSPDEKIYVTYYEYDHVKYNITENIHELELKQYIHDDIVGSEDPLPVTVLLPYEFDGTLTSRMSAGDITVEDFIANTNDINITTNAGNINMINTTALNNTILSVDVGSINLTDIIANKINLSVDVGNISGSIKGNRSNFNISSSVNIGNNSLGNAQGSPNSLDAKINIGNLDVTFRE